MKARTAVYLAVSLAALGLIGRAAEPLPPQAGAAPSQASKASFRVDPSWPKELPNDWVVGNVVGVAVDSKDNVWITHRPKSQQNAESTPPVLAIDPAGNLLHSWGGPGEGAEWGGPSADGKYEWGTQMHGAYVDYQDNVWVGFGGGLPYEPDKITTYGNAMVLKFTPEAKFLLQIGRWGKTEGSNSTQFLGMPTDIFVDPKGNEVFISDGYANRRVIVFDANTGRYQRHWGAYGEKPVDGPMPRFTRGGDPPKQFSTPHCIVGSADGLIYVCDRGNERIQVFQKDGTFVKEAFVNGTIRGGQRGGTPWDIALSPDPQQRLIYLVDGTHHRIHVLQRDTLNVVETFGHQGRWAGNFESPHSIAVDSKGNLFVAETLDGRRVQKFVPQR